MNAASTRIINTLEVSMDRHELRVHQAHRLFQCGWPGVHQRMSFNAYLLTIPEIPEQLFAKATAQGAHLILADERASFTEMCRYVSVWYPRAALPFLEYAGGRANGTSVYWFAVKFSQDAVPSRGITLLQGIFVYVQFPQLFWHKPVMCAASRFGDSNRYRACFDMDTSTYAIGAIDAFEASQFLAPALLA